MRHIPAAILLAAVADRPLPYEFVVLNSGELNAWALPGGMTQGPDINTRRRCADR